MIEGISKKELLELRIKSDEAVIAAFPRASLTDTSGGKELFDLCRTHWQSVLETLSEKVSSDTAKSARKNQSN